MTVRLAIAGAGGRMGQALVEAVLADPGLVLASALDAHDSPALGRDAGERIGRASGVIADGVSNRRATRVPRPARSATIASRSLMSRLLDQRGARLVRDRGMPGRCIRTRFKRDSRVLRARFDRKGEHHP